MMSLEQVAEHYRTMAATDPDAGQRELWLQMADDVDDYLAFDAVDEDLLMTFDTVDDEDPKPWSRSRPNQ